MAHCSIYILTQISNQPVTWQQLKACRSGEVQTTEWGDLRDFERGMVVGTGWSEFFRNC